MLPDDEIIIRDYLEGDEGQINDLHNKEYNTNRNIEQWKWEFQNGPCGKSIFVVAEYKGKIIGTQALLPIILSQQGNDILSGKSEETLVDRDFRGKGILKKLLSRCFDIADKRGIKVIWGFTPQDEIFKRSGFHISGKLKYAILTINCFQTYQLNKNKVPNIFNRNVISPIIKNLAEFFFVMFSFLQFKSKIKKVKSSNNCSIEIISNNDSRLDRFWQYYRQKKQFITIARTSRYLRWRIFENPNLSSRIIAAMINSEIYGYVIVSVNDCDNSGIIVDFCMLDDLSDEIALILMNNAIEYLNSQGAAFIVACYANTNSETKRYVHTLKKIGFTNVPGGSAIVLKQISNDNQLGDYLKDVSSWYITYLFSEGTN
jgi:GNAT superfamily N-acetyltransferase